MFSKTKLVLEVEVSTQFGPKPAVQLVKTLLDVPAINDLKVVSVQSNYQLHENPSILMQPIDLEDLL